MHELKILLRAMRRSGRSLLLLAALAGVMGCSLSSLVQGGEPPATAAALPTATPGATSTATSTAVPTAVAPTSTSPVPSLTPFASLTPFPSLTPMPNGTLSATVTATPLTLYGGCCTLRVRNSGSVMIWIGKDRPLPRNGQQIPSRHYLEFYEKEPTYLDIYWCLYFNPEKTSGPYKGHQAKGTKYLYDCRHREIWVPSGLTEISVQ